MWTGVPVNQYGFGVYKAHPYQRGYGAYRSRRRRRGQRGHGFASALKAIGRAVLPAMRRVGTSVVKKAGQQALKELPKVLGSQNKKAAFKGAAERIGKGALQSAVTGVLATGGGGPPPKRRRVGGSRRLKRRGQFR